MPPVNEEVSELRQQLADLRALHARPHPEIEILELREAGSDGGGFMGYYCHGHVDKEAFARAANWHGDHLSGYGFDPRYVYAQHVIHLWWRTVPISGQDGEMRFVPSAGPGRGAWAATVGEMQMRRFQRERRRMLSDYDQGRMRGIEEALAWAHGVLQWGSGTAEQNERLREAGEYLLKCWSAWGAKSLERERKQAGE